MIAYDRRGQGPPIVFAHGGASDSREWTFQLDDLADEFLVVAWDEPGNGRSSDLPEGWGLAESADALASLIAALDLAPCHLGGLSWGGVVALELYRRHPATVATLILVDTYAGWKGSLSASEIESRVTAFERSHKDPGPPEAGYFPGLFKVDPLPPRIAELLTEMDADVRPETIAALIPAVAAADLSELLPRISVPVLLIWGDSDVRSPVELVGHQFRDAIPGANLVVIADSGHVSNIEQPEQVNRAVRAFCRSHPLPLGGI
jgi:pimeloyl-ACP methyl ester carboxylesterase